MSRVRAWQVAAWCAGGALLALGVAALLILRWLSPAAGEWHEKVSLAGLSVPMSMPKLLRLVRTSLVWRVLDGRTVRMAGASWHLGTRSDGGFSVACAPCGLRAHALGVVAIELPRVSLQALPVAPDTYRGELVIGEPARGVHATAQLQIEPDGIVLQLDGGDVPLARLAVLLAPRAADVAHASIAGTLSFTLQWRHPQRTLRITPQVQGFSVSGLGTERLLYAALPLRCAPTPRVALRGWLRSAVIAAEDQRFYTHPGYDLAELQTVAQSAGQPGARPRGASTLTQQLAKLLFTGEQRSVARKVRELLYAVEMERTLGKARILQLYLAIAPWGQGLCGAEGAALAWLGKPARALTPVEAAWLAGLLRNPDAQLTAQRADRQALEARITQVLAAMRPMARWRRTQALAQIAAFSPRVLQADARRVASR